MELEPDMTPDVERCAAALRLVRHKTRCPEFVAEALAEWERRQSQDTAEAIVAATERMMWSNSAPQYVTDALLGMHNEAVDAELARPAR